MVAVSGPLQGRTFPLRLTPCTVGRQSGCEVQILDLSVSRAHCELERDGEGTWRVRDLDSRHGTFVNGQPVHLRALGHGDLVQVGASSLVFLAPSAPRERDPSLPSYRAGSSAAQIALQKRLEDHPFAQRGVWPAAGTDSGRAAEERGVLLRLCSAVQAARDVGALGDCALDLLRARLPSCRGAVLLAVERPELDELRLLACAPATAQEQALCPTVLTQVLKDRVALWCREGGVEMLGVPLAVGERVFGALYLEATRGHRFEERHLDFAIAVAAVASPALDRLAQLSHLRRENRQLRGGVELADNLAEVLLGESAAMHALRAQIRRAASAGGAVLLTGEPGSGKATCARAIHAISARADGPFAVVHCAALADWLLESELFGHEPGAYAGAVSRKRGQLEQAHGGTLFLDEIGELPAPLQARLLRVLQDRELERAGGARPVRVDVRVIAATSRELAALVHAGKLREDLLSRLGAISLAVPPLRERREDVPLLARHFARAAGARAGRRIPGGAVGLSAEAVGALTGYDWPGNVRQLGNVIERALLLGGDDTLQLEDLPDEVLAARPALAAIPALPAIDGTDSLGEPSGAFCEVILATKRVLVMKAYARARGDHERAALALGVHVRSLHRLVRTLGLEAALGKAKDSPLPALPPG